jgi:ketosteroid isomerase-like protein
MKQEQDVKLDNLLLEIFTDVCNNGVEAIRKHFHSDYVHRVNGVELDYKTYEKHFAERQEFLASASFEIDQIIAGGDQVGTVHKFHMEKKDGTKTSLQLIAVWQFRGKKLIRGDEAAKPIEGDLASVIVTKE